MLLLRSMLAPAGIAMSLGGVACQGRPHPLPLSDQVAVYRAVLEEEAALLRRDGPHVPLLLVLAAAARSGYGRDTTGAAAPYAHPLDTAVIDALLGARAVTGLCWPVATRRCEGRQRGYGVRLGDIQLEDSTHAAVAALGEVMMAERDNTLLVRSPARAHVWHLRHVEGRWEALPEPPRRGP